MKNKFLDNYVKWMCETHDLELDSYDFDVQSGALNINVKPRQAIEYIELNFTITESGGTSNS